MLAAAGTVHPNDCHSTTPDGPAPHLHPVELAEGAAAHSGLGIVVQGALLGVHLGVAVGEGQLVNGALGQAQLLEGLRPEAALYRERGRR